MESVFTVILLTLVLLFYFSNRGNKVNKWCAAAGFIFWLGVAKEAFMYNVVPYLQTAFAYTVPYSHYKGAYSAMTWALYSFAMPTAVVFSLHFNNMDVRNPRLMRLLKVLLYVPALLLSFFFPPFAFRDYQLSSLPFWISYSVHNLSLGVVFAFFLLKGVRDEKPGKTKAQKKRVCLIVLPPVLFWMLSVFLTHPFRLTGLFKLWQGNVFILLVCVALYIYMAFKDGFMGLRLSGETYKWNTDLGIIHKGAEYTGHMLKNQTTKMNWCIENLKAQYSKSGGEAPEELAILTRSITALKSYIDKMRKHSETIHLLEESCNIKALLENSSASFLSSRNDISIELSVQDNVFLFCDKTHMSEVFTNILLNALEATRGPGTIEITDQYDRRGLFYLLRFTDHGVGMSKEELKSIFTPYFTTKNTQENFGLGLSYCKNVVEKHGGYIEAKSKPGRGTVVTIALPKERVSLGEGARETVCRNA